MFANNHFFNLYLRKELKFQVLDYNFLKIPGFPGFPEAFSDSRLFPGFPGFPEKWPPWKLKKKTQNRRK